MRYQMSQKGRQRLRNEEGKRLTPYKCASDKWTIGFGHRIYSTDKIPNLIYLKPLNRWVGKISDDQAEAMLTGDIDKAQRAIDELVHVPLNQNHVDALVIFIHNIGRNAFAGSTMLAYLNQKLYGSAALQIKRWIHDDHGNVIDGLKARQDRTAELFKTPVVVKVSS